MLNGRRLFTRWVLHREVACSGEKSASEQKVVAPEVRQEKTVVTDGKYRKKTPSSPQCASERVVVENNSLRDKLNPPIKIIDINQLGPKVLDENGDPLVGGGGIGKGKGSAMPVPVPTKASNGLVYQSNGKHTPGQLGYNRNAGTEPKNSIQLFGSSIENGKKRYALDENGNVHQFTNTNDGSWHWSGSTGDPSVPLKKNDIPSAVKKELGLPGKWR